MADKTFNLKVVGSMRDLKGLLEGSLTSFRIPDGVTSLFRDTFYRFPQLTELDLNQIEVIPAEMCKECPNLANVIFTTHTTQIGDYAFYNCTKFEDTELPHTLTNIGQYAFYNVGSYYDRGTHTFTMIDDVGVHTTIGNYAFYESHLSEITAYLNNVGERAFQNCSSLTTVNVEIHGSLGGSAFYNCKYVMDFRIDPNSVITSLGSSVFTYLGSNTYSDASFHVADFDFRNSTFTSLSSYVWGYCHFNGKVYFPSTLKEIRGDFLYSATGNWVTHFNSIPSVSSSSYLRSDNPDTFTVRYAFPYTKLDAALTTTNWSSHTSQMVGYGTDFEAETTLPAYRRDTGVGITWYSDAAMTMPATTSLSAMDIYYCSLGSTRLVWFVDTPSLLDASFTISDGSTTYGEGSPIPVNTTVTITPSYTDPTKDQLFLFKVNDVDYTSAGTATIQVTESLIIKVAYWDGEHQPFLPILSDNPWSMIKLASQLNAVPSTWNAGDTKTFTYNGDTYTARLVDKTGKYKRASDDSTAYLSFEVTELLPDYGVYNSSNYNNPRESELLAKMNSGTIWDNMDVELKSVLETVKVKVAITTYSSAVIDWEGKLFLPREHDLFSTKNYSLQVEWDLITQDQYYQENNTDSARIKYRKNYSSAGGYWEMSPSNDGQSYTCFVVTNGFSSSMSCYSSLGVAVRFAL